MLQKKFNENYLVIGSTKHIGSVDTFSWVDETIQSIQLDQYKTLILHFDAIPSNLIQTNEESTRVIVKKDNGMELLSNIDTRILKNLVWIGKNLVHHSDKENTNVIIITSPINRFNSKLFERNLFIPRNDAEAIQLEQIETVNTPFAGEQAVKLQLPYFSNFEFKMRVENNISMINANDLVKPYFDEFSSHNFVFEVQGQHSPLAATFYNNELAFSQMIEGIDIIVLPHPRMISPHDTIEIILREIIGIKSDEHLKFPDWIDNYNTVRQHELISEMTQLEKQIDGLKQQIKEKMTEFDLFRDFQRILFTKGEILRNSLFEMFKSMGLKVSQPENALSHHIELENAEKIFILQVISLEDNKLERSVLRQLNQWVEQKEEAIEYSKSVKGVAIVNYSVSEDPVNREILVMEEAAKDYIEKLGFCILPTQELFKIYNTVEKGDVGKFEALDKIGSTRGIFRTEILPEN